MTWHEKIKQARIQKGITQREVAAQLGITLGCYAHYENGIREPSIELLPKLCIALDISADYLLGLSDDY